MAALLDTPSRVLKRVQQYEEMELPSLPSFQQSDLDLSDVYDGQESLSKDFSSNTFEPEAEHDYDSTPHVPRTLRSPPPTSSTVRTESTVKAGIRSSPTAVPTPTLPSRNQLPDSYMDLSYDSVLDNLSVSDTSASASKAAPSRSHAYDDYSSMSDRLPAAATGSYEYEDTGGYQTSSMATPMFRAAREASYSVIDKTPKPILDGRIPSLSRSEASATDNEATTPEGRDGAQMTIASVHVALDDSLDRTKPEPNAHDATDEEDDLSSPHNMATPAAIRYMDQPSTAARAAATPFGNAAPLRDATPRYRNRQSLAPSVASPSVDYASTPRAPLDDIARRKSHVLSVLASASLPSRVRSRPSPLQRSYRPSDSSSGFSPSVGSTSHSVAQRSDLLDDSATHNTSAMSLASNDSVADRSSANIRYRRGNTSVPNILLGTGANLNLENRPDAVKIHKHLNMMNQQLLDTNADLAREAEDWRGECRRLIDIMREAGIEIDDQGLVADLGVDVADGSGLPSSTGDRPQSLKQSQDSASSEHADTAELQRRLQEAEDELSNVKGDFATQTANFQRGFEEIAEDYTRQIQVLQEARDTATADANALRSEASALRVESATLRTQLEALPAGAAQGEELRTQIASLGGELAQAKEDAQVATEELATKRVQLSEAEGREQAAIQQLEDAQEHIATLQSQLDAARREEALASSRAKDLQERLTATENRAEQNSRESTVAEGRASAMETENTTLQKENTALSQQLSDLEGQQSAIAKQIEELEARSAAQDDEALVNKKRIEELESLLSAAHAVQSNTQAELESVKGQLGAAALENSRVDETQDATASFSRSMVDAELLDAANRQIGRLKAELAAVPATQATIEAREARIRALETEKEALLERVKVREAPSPSRWGSSLRASTPFVHKTIAALREPRTPGSLNDLSWLQTTIEDSNESLLRVQLEHLQHELDAANNQLDANFDRLEQAGLGAVRLSELLAAANAKIAQYEAEHTALSQKNKESEASVDRGRYKNEQLEAALETVNERLSILREDMSAEKDRLNEDNRRLRLAITDIQLKYDERLEQLSADAARVQEEAQDDVNEAAQRIERVRKEKETLATQLRKSEALVKQLEREASALHSSIDELHRTLDKLRGEVTSSGRAHAEIRSLQDALAEAKASLRDAQQESSRMRDQLRRRSDEVAATTQEVDTLKEERERVTRELGQFNEDIKVQRGQVAAFGAELQLVRKEQAATQNKHTVELGQLKDSLQAKQADLILATQRAEDAQHQCSALQEQLSSYEAQVQTTTESRRKFKNQVRRLSAQIEFLKAVYARENSFRSALALQKKFLLLLVGGMSLNEQATLREIVSMGYDVPQPSRPKRTLRSVGLAVLATIRARRLATQWEATQVARRAGIDRSK